MLTDPSQPASGIPPGPFLAQWPRRAGIRVVKVIRRHDPFEAVLVSQVKGLGQLVEVLLLVSQNAAVSLGVVVVHKGQSIQTRSKALGEKKSS